jgi:hypothetical protein
MKTANPQGPYIGLVHEEEGRGKREEGRGKREEGPPP